MTIEHPQQQLVRKNAISLSFDRPEKETSTDTKGHADRTVTGPSKFYPGDTLRGSVLVCRKDNTVFDKLIVSFRGGVVGGAEEWFKVDAEIGDKKREVLPADDGTRRQEEATLSESAPVPSRNLEAGVVYEFPFSILLPSVNYPAPYGHAALSRAFTLSAFLTFVGSNSFAASPMVCVPFYPRLSCTPNKVTKPLLSLGRESAETTASTTSTEEKNSESEPADIGQVELDDAREGYVTKPLLLLGRESPETTALTTSTEEKNSESEPADIGQVELDDAREGYASEISFRLIMKEKGVDKSIPISSLALSLIFDDIPNPSAPGPQSSSPAQIPDMSLATFTNLHKNPSQRATIDSAGTLQIDTNPSAVKALSKDQVEVAVPVPKTLPCDECVLKLEVQSVDGRRGITGWLVVLGKGVVDERKGEKYLPTWKRPAEDESTVDWAKPVFI